MTRRSAAAILAVALLGFSSLSDARGGRGHFSGGHFAAPAARFHSVPHFHHFAPRTRVFIGGAFIAAPLYFPPPPVYYAPPPAYYSAPPSTTYYYCPAYGAYYPQVQQCPGGWQMVPG